MERTKNVADAQAQDLGDETFMSADDLLAYMRQTAMARASKDANAMDRAANARETLVKTLSEPMILTPEVLNDITRRLLSRLRVAAERGDTELMVMRFPCALCSDRGRAINNNEAGWPATLIGRPRQAYELWRDRLQPAGFRLTAMIVDWPEGLPGDVGFFLEWGDRRKL